MKYSLIIIGYNVQDYIFRCLDSVVKQSYKNIEIIYVDDGSTDSSIDIVKNFSCSDKRIKIIEDKNNGPYIARLHGLQKATGDYFLFLDGDDWIEKQTVEMLNEQIKKNNLDVILFDYIKDDCRTNDSIHNRLGIESNIILDREKIKSLILPNLMFNSCFCSPCNKIYKLDFVKKTLNKKNITIKYGEDMIFLLDVFDNLEQTIYLDREFYHYCINNNNSLSQIHYDDSFNTVVKPLFEIRYKYAINWDCQDELYLNTLYLGICELVFDLKNRNDLSIIKDKLFLLSINNTKLKKFYKKYRSKKLLLVLCILKLVTNRRRKDVCFEN